MIDTIQQDSNICGQCGGTIRMTYVMGFEQGRPVDLRSDPLTMLKLCPGHPKASLASQEDQLPNEQRYSLLKLRQRMQDHFDAEISAFYAKHSDVRLDYDFTVDAFTNKSE